MAENRSPSFAFACLALAILLLPITFSSAETYQWQDKHGRTIIGTKPPTGAKAVSPIKTKPISRYSSNKLIGGYERAGIAPKKSSSIKETPLIADLDPSPIETKQTKKAKDTGRAKLAQVDSFSMLPKLENEPVVFEATNKGDITSCTVAVRNQGNGIARGVTVSFLFSDGTLIPADGPVSLEPGERADYAIPKNHLPLALNKGAAKKKNSPEVPEVVLNFEQETSSERAIEEGNIPIPE